MSEALNYGEKKVEINLDDIVVEQGYQGPRLDNGVKDINGEWVVKLMAYLKDGKVLHKRYAVMIIQKARELFAKEKSLVDIPVRETEEITVCGDIHG